MPTTLVTCELLPASGLPRDIVINSWAVLTGVATDPTDVADAFGAFYGSWDAYLSDSVQDTLGLRVSSAVVNLPGGTLEPADFIGDYNLAPPASQALPQEVSTCLSFRSAGDPGGEARSRGRVYLGPLNSSALATVSGTGEYGVPSSAFVAAVVNAAESLAESLGTAGASWCVWSRSDGVFKLVTDGWVDNEFDTVRSRGRVATSRSTFSV